MFMTNNNNNNDDARVPLPNATTTSSSLHGTIAFASVGTAHFAFDVYESTVLLQSHNNSSPSSDRSTTTNCTLLSTECKTDGRSRNYNARYSSNCSRSFAFISERDGNMDVYYLDEKTTKTSTQKFFPPPSRLTFTNAALEDHPTFSPDGQYMAFVSTRERPQPSRPRLPWTAIYVMSLKNKTRRSSSEGLNDPDGQQQRSQPLRLTPVDRADFSPAWSPDGQFLAFAQVRLPDAPNANAMEQTTDIGIMDARTGKNRRLLALDGGWPTWRSDSRVIYYHAMDPESRTWSIYQVDLDDQPQQRIVRVSPTHLHVMTPSAFTRSTACDPWIVVATREANNDKKHDDNDNDVRTLALLHTQEQRVIEIPRHVLSTSNPSSSSSGRGRQHQYNPSAGQCHHRTSPDGEDQWTLTLLHHACRGGEEKTACAHELLSDGSSCSCSSSSMVVPYVEKVSGTSDRFPALSMIRTLEDFPAISPNGEWIATSPDFAGVAVMRLNGSSWHRVFDGPSFYVSWSPDQKHLATSFGHVFQPANATVQVLEIDVDITTTSMSPTPTTQLSEPFSGNNAFGSYSPDGEWMVFRSGVSGYKNLYITSTNASSNVPPKQLTFGNHTDTMPNWSPDGTMIAFSREHLGNYSIWRIAPTGENLTLLVADGGRNTHPWFSPDSQWLVFASDMAGLSAEIVSVPFQFQPYGEIFLMKAEDGSHIERLTHNANEDGTPTWGRLPLDVASTEGNRLQCRFRDIDVPKFTGSSNLYATTPHGCPYAKTIDSTPYAIQAADKSPVTTSFLGTTGSLSLFVMIALLVTTGGLLTGWLYRRPQRHSYVRLP